MNTLTPKTPLPPAPLVRPRPSESVWLDALFVALTGGLAAAALLSGSLLVGLTALAPGLYVLLFILVRRPLWALGAALAVQHFSGLIKQLSNFSQAGYAVQDVTFALVLVPLVLRRILRPPTHPLPVLPLTAVDVLITLFVVFNCLQAFNPESPSPYLALAAVRVRLLPLLMYAFVRSMTREGLKIERTLFSVMAVCVLIGAAFAFYESYIGVNGVKALGPGFWPKQASRVWADASGEQHFRPPSIYADAGIAVTVAGMFAVFALALPTRRGAGWNGVLRWLPLVGGMAQVVVTGARGGFLTVVAGLVFLMVFTRNRTALYGLLILPVVLGLAILVQPKILDRYATVANPTQAYSENRGWTWQTLAYEAVHYPMGLGTGTATTGAASVANLVDIDPARAGAITGYDNGWANLLHEMGLGGVLLYLGLMVSILWAALAAARPPRPGVARPFLPVVLATWAVMMLVGTGGSLVTDAFPINVYFWAMTALTLTRVQMAKTPERGRRAWLSRAAPARAVRPVETTAP